MNDREVHRPEVVGLVRRKPPLLVRFLMKWAVLAIALWVAVKLIGGLEVDGGFGTYVWIALVFGLVNAVVGNFIKLFSIPLILATMGLAIFVINALMLELTDALLGSFQVNGFGSALLGALVISCVSVVLNTTVVKKLR